MTLGHPSTIRAPDRPLPPSAIDGDDPGHRGIIMCLAELLIVAAVVAAVYFFVGLQPGEGVRHKIFEFAWLNNLLIASQIWMLRKSYGSGVGARGDVQRLLGAVHFRPVDSVLVRRVTPFGADVLDSRVGTSPSSESVAFYLISV